jgi:hypothetical protein
MFAAKPHEAEQELPEGIPEPRNVVREWRRPVATDDQVDYGDSAFNVARERFTAKFLLSASQFYRPVLHCIQTR